MSESTETANVEQAFLATASHEIRTPLNGILGMVSLLLETELNPSQREYADAIRNSGERLLDLLNNVLDFARMDAGDIVLSSDMFRPANLAREVLELLASRVHGKSLDIALRTKFGSDVALRGDSGKIRQILFNLVGNALKFTESGAILIDLDVIDDRLVLRIIDTGPGIPDRAQEKLFQAFQQVNAEDANKDGGVGLGLAIVKRLCDAMGGDISVHSLVDTGTCFTVTLPVETTKSIEAETSEPTLRDTIGLVGLPSATTLATAKALQHAGATVLNIPPSHPSLGSSAKVFLASADLPERALRTICETRPTLIVLRHEDRAEIPKFRTYGAAGWLIRPMRPNSIIERVKLAIAGGRVSDSETKDSGSGHILIADDNPINGLIARRALESSGFAVTVASNGREALDLAEQIGPDLVLMDLRMPIMDGFEAIRRLRSEGSRVPVIAVSAEIDPDIEKRARFSGANGVAAKPLEAEALRQLAFKWIAPNDQAGAA